MTLWYSSTSPVFCFGVSVVQQPLMTTEIFLFNTDTADTDIDLWWRRRGRGSRSEACGSFLFPFSKHQNLHGKEFWIKLSVSVSPGSAAQQKLVSSSTWLFDWTLNSKQRGGIIHYPGTKVSNQGLTGVIEAAGLSWVLLIVSLLSDSIVRADICMRNTLPGI